MPSKLKQINVRVTDDIHARMLALMERMQARLGIEVSQSDTVRAGILALERDYPPSHPATAEKPKPASVPEPSPAKRTKKRNQPLTPKGT